VWLSSFYCHFLIICKTFTLTFTFTFTIVYKQTPTTTRYYRNNHNFQIYGHQKFKVGNIESFGNVLLWVSEYGGHWSAAGNIPGKPNAMYNNTVVFAPQETQAYHSVSPSGQPQWTAYDNHLFGQNVTLSEGKKVITLAEYQAMDPAHYDVGSTWSKEVPPPATMVEWGRTLLLS
jgi:hypothetical protein